MIKMAIIGAPTSAGARQTGQELAPAVLRELGLVDRLRSSGADVLDFGDLPTCPFSPDLRNPKSQNLDQVIRTVEQVSAVVSRAVRAGALPIVLGGDCTVTIGALAGTLKHERNLGLVYFDGDVDLNTPETTLSGILDGMVMAHIVGLASNELARIGPRFPLMSQKDVIVFGYNTDGGGIDPIESQLLPQMLFRRYPSSTIRGNAESVAKSALGQFDHSIRRIVVHFDVDVIDSLEFPATDVPHRNGLSNSDTMDALRVFLSSHAFGGLVLTEFNVHRDENGSCARRLVESVSRIIESAHSGWVSMK